MFNYLSTAPLNEIVRYDKRERAPGEYVQYRGAVRKHPYDAGKFILVSAPVDAHSHFYEFRFDNVVFAREVNQVVSESGETMQVVDIGIEKGAHAIEMRPFQVE